MNNLYLLLLVPLVMGISHWYVRRKEIAEYKRYFWKRLRGE